jgi:hypothetical protein
MDQMVDIISILPNGLLCHILSVLRIDFDYEIEDEAFERFCHFVDTIMFSPLALDQPLKTLHLKCTSETSIASLWLEATKCRDVEEFHLIMNFHTLQPNIFISQTLVVLKLDTVKIARDTSYVYLPSVKTLDLKFVYFKTRKDYVNFLYGCPILQDLHSKHIYVRGDINDKNNVVPEKGFKSSVTLSKLDIASISSKDVMFNGIGNVEFLRIVTGFRSQEASFKFIPVFSNLIHIDLMFFHSSFHCWDGVVELLGHSPKLQILVIKKVRCYLCWFTYSFLSLYILINVFYSFDSGQAPAQPKNGNAQFRFLNVFRLTSNHVLF